MLSARTRSEREPVDPKDRRAARLYAFGAVVCVWMALIGLRLWDFQVRQADRFENRAARQHEGLIEIEGRRGTIYDRRGAELAMSTPAESIGVFPPKIKEPELVASLLSEVLGVNEGVILKKLRSERFQWVKRLAEPGEAERVRNLNLSGIQFERESKRYYPKGTVAAHVIGAVGVDHHGQSGIELRFNEMLTGRPGSRMVRRDALRKGYESEIVEAPIPGASLYLTVDESIQSAAEQQLAQAIKRTGSRAGSVVVMDPETGDVLALANWPFYDPNQRPRGSADLKLRHNYGLSHLYEPGSTFKVITVAAAIEEGLTTPEELIDCQNGAIYIGRRRIRDHKKFGVISVSDVIAHSSNVGAVKLAQRLGAERLHEYVTRFGFGKKTGIELPGEINGLLRPARTWRDGSTASIAIGHEIGATPLQVAQAFCVIANGGYFVRARVVDSIRDASGRIQRIAPAEKKRVISAKTAAAMRAMMEQVVRRGSGMLAQTSGYRVAGKSGTAQVADPELGGYTPGRYIASFGGFGPVNNPSVVALVVLDSPRGKKYYGGQIAAPAFPELVSQALRQRDVPPTEPLESAEESRPVPDEMLADLAQIEDDEEQEPLRVPRTPRGEILVASLGVPDAEEPAPLLAEGGRAADLRLTDRITPDLSGLNMRQALAQASRLGLRVDSSGAGVALRQSPAPGTPLARGSLIAVEFGRSRSAMEGGQ